MTTGAGCRHSNHIHYTSSSAVEEQAYYSVTIINQAYTAYFTNQHGHVLNRKCTYFTWVLAHNLFLYLRVFEIQFM